MGKLDNTIWKYETRCRRCGHFTEWLFGQRISTRFHIFQTAILDYINEPRQYCCSVCGKHTVQDVVSYDKK